jgi:hypothetical protein
MKLRIPPLAAATCFLLVNFALADTIFLKDGGKIEGTLVREDDDNYVMEVQVSGTIRDEKVVPRGDVLRFEKEKPDLKAFREIDSLFPTPDLLRKEAYEGRIEKLGEFLKEFPASGMVPKVKDMLDILNGELAIVTAGGIKLGGEMIEAEDYDANAYEYDVRIAETRIKSSVKRRDFLGSLRKFDEYEPRFGVSQSRNDLAALMVQVLLAYNTTIEESLATIDVRLKNRSSGLEIMSAEDRAKTERALEEQMAGIKDRYVEEKTSLMKWITPDSLYKESLENAKRQITAELTRLATPAAVPEVPLTEVYRTSWELLLEGTDEEKRAVIEDAKLKRLPEFYLSKLRERAVFAEE